MKKEEITLIIGASENPERYSNKAALRLLEKGFKIKLLGNKEGQIENHKIEIGRPNYKKIHTVTLYIGPALQPQYYDYIVALKPKRVIFNPGTENPEFITLLKKHQILAEESCTLVLLSLNSY